MHNPRAVQAPRKRKSRSPPRPELRVIRRVRTVVAVKQEESDDDPAPSEKRNHNSTKPSVSIRKRQQALFRNDDQTGASDGSAEGPLDVDPSPEQEDSDDQDELMLVGEVCREHQMPYPSPDQTRPFFPG